MGHIQAVIQPLQKRSGPDSGVERRGGDGNHLRLAVPRDVEPVEELLLLFVVQGVHISKNHRPVGGRKAQERIAGHAAANRFSQIGCDCQDEGVRRVSRAADEDVRLRGQQNRPIVGWWVNAKAWRIRGSFGYESHVRGHHRRGVYPIVRPQADGVAQLLSKVRNFCEKKLAWYAGRPGGCVGAKRRHSWKGVRPGMVGAVPVRYTRF